MNKYLKIAIAVIVCVVVGYFSGQATRNSILNWYPMLKKPFFNPPNEVFAPVWTILFIMMGVAAGMIWNEIKTQSELVKKGLLFFCIQLILNALWSFIFFELKNILLASIEIIILWLVIFETYLLFKKINPTASKLLIPYLAWVGFATILTITIYFLNF